MQIFSYKERICESSHLRGSPRYPSRSSALLEYARETLSAADIEVCHWHLQNFAPEDLLYARFDNPALHALRTACRRRWADHRDAVYKASFSGALKTLLDLLPERALEGKIVLPLATGGTHRPYAGGGLRLKTGTQRAESPGDPPRRFR